MITKFMTMREYEAIVIAYSRLVYEIDNGLIEGEFAKTIKSVIDIIDKFTERISKQIEVELSDEGG